MTEPMLEYRGVTPNLELPRRDGQLEVIESGPMARFVLRIDEGAAPRLSGAFGVSLEHRLNRACASGARASLRLGPDEWLLLAEADAATALEQALADAASGSAHALVDVSHRSAGLDLTGAHVTDALASACPLPLEGARFAVDRCVRTVFGKAEIVLWRRAPEHFYLEAARSFVPYVVGLLNAECAALPNGMRRPREVHGQA